MSTAHKTLEEVIETQREIFNRDFAESPFVGAVQELNYETRISLAKKYCSKNDIVLSVGCGDGTVIKGLSPFVKKIVALDVSENAIRIAKKFNFAQNIEYIHGSIEEYDGKEKFNTVLLYEVIEHLFDPKFVLKKMSTLMTDNAIVCLSTPNFMRTTRRVKMLPIISHLRKMKGKSNDRINCDHVAEYTFHQIKEFFISAGFEVASHEGIMFWTNTIGGDILRNVKWVQKVNFFLGSLCPSMAGHMYVVARKV